MAIVSGGLAVLVLLVVVVLVVTLGDGGGTPTPSPTLAAPTRTPTPTTSAPSPASTEFDRFFTTQKLRDYARPYYGEMKTCEDAGTGSASAQCTFDDGHEVLIFEVPTAVTFETWRATLSASPQLSGAAKGTWAKGAKWTLKKDSGAVLYWDSEGERVGGLVIKSDEAVSDLESWWSRRFGK